MRLRIVPHRLYPRTFERATDPRAPRARRPMWLACWSPARTIRYALPSPACLAATMPIKNVLFDHDGTLLSTLRVRSIALERAMLEVMDRTVEGEAIFARTHGQSLQEMGDWLTDGDDDKTTALIAAYREHYYVNNDVGFEPYAGIRETIESLSADGVKLAVVTSKLHRGARDELTDCQLIDFFQCVVGSDDVRKHKPHPEPLLAAMNAIGAKPAETLMVGDTTADIFGAKAAGTHSAAALWDTQDVAAIIAAEPDYRLSRPQDVLALVAQ